MIDHRVVIIFALSVGFYICQEEFRCKLDNPGSDIMDRIQKNDFPITCTSVGSTSQPGLSGDGIGESEAEELRKEINDLKAFVLSTQNELIGLQQKNKNLEGEVTGLKTELRRLLAESSNHEEEIVKLQEENNDAKKEMADLRRISQKQDKEMKELKAENDNMRKELNDMASMNKKQNEELKALRSPIPTTPTTVAFTRHNTTERSTLRSQPSTTQQPKKECRSDEFTHGDKCYWIVIREDCRRLPTVSFPEAKSICESRHGIVAFPISEAHYDVIMNQARSRIPSGWYGVKIWLGIYQSPSTGELSVSDTREESFIRWADGEPERESDYTNVFLYVHRAVSSRWNGMGDYYPSGSTDGVVCQY